MASRNPIEDDTRCLAALRGLPALGIAAALADGVLSFGVHLRQRAWFIRDERAGCVRRLDGEDWQAAKALDTPGTSGVRVNGWLVGVAQAAQRQRLIICEGGPDLLAAYAVRETLRADFGIVCSLGATLTIHESARALFAGKCVRIIADTDEAGRAFAERNAALLASIGADVSIADLRGLRTATGAEASDLCDVLAFREPWCVPDEIAGVFDFTRASSRIRLVPKHGELFAPVSAPSTGVTKDDRITKGEQTRTDEGERGEREKELTELCEKARALACTAREQTHKRLFSVAREVRAFELRRGGTDMATRLAAFDAWHSASRPHLDPSETREDYLGRFPGMLRKVRSPAGGKQTLARAIARARAQPLPDLPGAPNATAGLRLLAAVSGELQRLAGDAPFLLATRDAGEIATGQRHAERGSRALEALDALGVNECVKRGDPWPGGNASRWRYLLPIPPQPESGDDRRA